MKTIGLNIISHEQISDDTLKRYAQYFDEVCVLYNSYEPKEYKQLEGIKTKVIHQKDAPKAWIKIDGIIYPNFAQLRQINLEMSTTDWVMYLDSDDDLSDEDLAKIKPFVEQTTNQTALGVLYAYNYAEHKSIEFTHPSTRIFKRDSYTWGDRFVHERLTPKENIQILEEFAEGIVVRHMREVHDQSNRNLPLLRVYFAYTDKKDALTAFYIGREMTAKDTDEARQWLHASIELGLDSVYQVTAYDLLSSICFEDGDLIGALEYAKKIIAFDPDNLIGLSLEAKLNFSLGNYEVAKVKCANILHKFIFEDGEYVKKAQMQASGIDIKTIRDQMLYTTAMIAKIQGQFDDSIQILKSIGDENLDKVINHFDYLKETEKKAKVQAEIAPKLMNPRDAFDDDTRATQIYIDAIQATGKQIKRKDSVVIVVTQNFEEWDEDTIIQKGGGGSETAVVEIAKRMAKDYAEVIVYANPNENKVINGVQYKKLADLDFSDEFDVFIGFRDVEIFHDRKIKANKKLLWLQDVARVDRYTPELLDNVDKILVLTKYHRNTLKHVPDNKIAYTTNGINIELIEEVEKEIKQERELNRLLYCSSADRGLELLAEMHKVYKYPAKIEWYYGWNSFAKQNDFKEKMIKLLDEVGIESKGRVSKKELYKAMFTADFLTYPLIGRAETSCIVAMEAQACGLIPITTGITALEETQQFGSKVSIDEYPEFLYNTIEQNKETSEKIEFREEMMKWARDKFNWDNVYKQWKKEIL